MLLDPAKVTRREMPNGTPTHGLVNVSGATIAIELSMHSDLGAEGCRANLKK
jgi:hypothetical protein